MDTLGEQEDKVVLGTEVPGLREVVEGGVNVNKDQDAMLKRANDVVGVQDEVLQSPVDLNNVQDEELQRAVDVENAQDEELQRAVDVENAQDEELQRAVDVENAQDEELQRAVDVENAQDEDLQRAVDVDNIQDEMLKRAVKVDMDKYWVLESPVEISKVRDGNLVGSMDVNKALDLPIKGSVDLDMGHNDKMESSVGQDDVLDDRKEDDKVLEADMNGEKVQVTHSERTRDKSGSVKVLRDNANADSALESILKNGVDVNEVVSETTRCQVKITTRHSLRLHMANHTARDVYVRLLDHGARISGSGLLALKDSVHLSPVKPLVMPEEVDLEESESQSESGEEDSVVPGAGVEKHEQVIYAEEDGSLAISDTAYSPCASVMPTPVEETQGGVDILFQSPGQLMKDLHADPEMQEELSAERERELAREAIRQSLCSQSNDTTQLRAFLNSTIRLVLVASVLLLLLLILLLILLESDLDVSFLQDIRETPEFEQFHYEYYCPLRRWLCYKLTFLTELLWGD